MQRLARAVLASLLATVPPGGASAATYDDDAASREGTCAGGIAWRMEATSHDGRIEIRARMDAVRYGRRWSWVLKHNGSLSDRGASRATGGGGSYEVERTAIDVSGLDTFRFRATRKAAVCVARVSL